MPTPRRRSHLSWLRALLLLAFVGVIGALVALLLFGRAGKRQETPEVSEEAGQASEGTTLIGKDFDYTYTEGERPLFRIRGDSIRADRNQTIYLDGVGLTLYDPQGRAYEVESKVASFNREQNEGELGGSVHLKGPSGLDLKTETLQIAEKGHVLLSPQPVEIGFAGQYVAHAATLRMLVKEEIYMLAGNVEVESVPGIEPPAHLRAQRLVYERPRRQVRVEGDAELARGPEQLLAQRISAFLSDDESSLLFVRALFEVEGRTKAELADGGKSSLHFTAEDLSVTMNPPPGAGDSKVANAKAVRQVELDSNQRGGVTLESTGAGVTRILTAKRVVGRMQEGILNSASAFRGVQVREVARQGGAVRQVTGDDADAGFGPTGQIVSVSLRGAATYTDPQLTVVGDRGRMDFDVGRGEFFGAPVDVRSPRGRMLAPHVVYTKSDGLMHADGGVRATLEQAADTAIAGSPLGSGEGPVRVESQDATWREEPRAFLFHGDVRAWRGESLLTAKDLRGDQEGPSQPGKQGQQHGKLTATGGVKTLWTPAATPAAAAPKTAPAGGKAAEKKSPGKGATPKPRQPIEVTAAMLVYVEPKSEGGKPAKGLLTYTGDVRVEQEDRVLTCRQLDVGLNAKREAETMTCTGQTHLSDPQAGRNVEAERAVYYVEQRLVEMFGDPVVLTDAQGNKVRGRHLVYHVDDGKVEVKGGVGTTTPAAGAPAPPAGTQPPPPGTREKEGGKP